MIPYDYEIFVGGVSVFPCGRDVNYYFQREDYDRFHTNVATKIPQTSVSGFLDNVTLLLLPTRDGLHFPRT